jgi:hypothetical protein
VSDRPPKLSFAAARVVMAARSLSAGEKVVWCEDRALDRGPEGTWLSGQAFERRWGGSWSRATLEEYRRRLVQLGLHVKVARPGARSMGWISTLPAQCLPRSDQPSDEEVETMAAYLDAHVKANGGRGPGPIQMRDSAQLSLDPEPNVRRGEGGRGEGPAQLLVREDHLHPPAGKADGEGARAPKAESGEGQLMSAEEQARLADIQRRHADRRRELGLG